MEQNYPEKPKNLSSNPSIVPYILLAGGVILFAMTLMLAQSLNLDGQAKFDDSPEAIATDTANLIETYPEFVNWERQVDRGISLWLPKTFVQFKVEEVMEMAKGNVEDVPYPLSGNVEHYANVPGTLHFLSFDESTYWTEYTRHITVVSLEVPQDLIDEFVSRITHESPGLTVLDPPIDEQFERYNGVHFVTSTELFLGSFATINYIIPHDGKTYVIGTFTSMNQLEETQEIMEKAINTLWIYNPN